MPRPTSGHPIEGRPEGMADDGHPVIGQTGEVGHDDSGHHDNQCSGNRGYEPAQSEQGDEGAEPDHHGESVDGSELVEELAYLGDRLVGLDGDPEHLAQLSADQHNGDAVQVAHQDRPGEVVGDPPEPDEPSHYGNGPDQDGQHRGQQGIRRSAARRERCHRGHHQQGKRSLRTHDELPGGAEQRVGHSRKQQGVQTGDRGEPSQFCIGHGRGDGESSHGDTGDGIPSHVPLGIVGQGRRHRKGPGPDGRPLAGLERRYFGVVAAGRSVAGLEIGGVRHHGPW